MLAHSHRAVTRRTPLLVLSMLLAWLVTGCADPTLQAQFDEMVVTLRQQAAAQELSPGNRLVIQGIDGNLYTTRPDGSESIALTSDASARRRYSQPTWSPSAEYVAYATVDLDSRTEASALVIRRFNGSAERRFSTPFAPFYIDWSPDETRLAYLSNWVGVEGSTIALRTADLVTPFDQDADALETLAEGLPLYFTWSPDGARILAHIGNERLEFRAPGGRSEALALTGAGFPAPQWSVDGNRIVYALGDGQGQRLVVSDPAGESAINLTDYSDSIAFSLNPTGDQLAYVVTPSGINTAAFGPLYVVDAAGRRTVELAAEPVLAFFWSPDGEKLAYLVVDLTEGTSLLKWMVWDGERRREYARITPTRTFLQSYIAFFDQYARGMTIWSPDSTAFAYAAVTRRGGPQIFVQALDADEPERVAPGVFVSWSPR